MRGRPSRSALPVADVLVPELMHGELDCKYKRARQKPNAYVQPSVFDMLAGESPASARDGWAE